MSKIDIQANIDIMFSCIKSLSTDNDTRYIKRDDYFIEYISILTSIKYTISTSERQRGVFFNDINLMSCLGNTSASLHITINKLLEMDITFIKRLKVDNTFQKLEIDLNKALEEAKDRMVAFQTGVDDPRC